MMFKNECKLIVADLEKSRNDRCDLRASQNLSGSSLVTSICRSKGQHERNDGVDSDRCFASRITFQFRGLDGLGELPEHT